MTEKDEQKLATLRQLYGDVGVFSRGLFPRWALRPYQIEAARAVVEAVRRNQRGEAGPNQFAIVFSRQAGKDEMVAQLLCYLLNLYQYRGGQIVMAAPTGRQVAISRARLLERLDNQLNRRHLTTSEGYIVGLGRANARFLSADPTSQVRGETASLLLIANETQDILPARWDAVFDPMAASTNAPTLFLGTVWTANTLLARQMRHLRELETQDGQQRVFLADWQRIAHYLPAYGRRVEARIAQFGEQHPFVQTEYCLRELDGTGGLFGPERRALMQGSHPRQTAATPGHTYALLIDLAGEDEAGLEGEQLRQAQPRKDSTAVTVVEIVPDEAELRAGPTYRVVQRYAWTGVKHPTLYGRVVTLARETWQARQVVVDATGVGAAMASFLDKALPGRVLSFVFTAASKSKLGWDFCGVVDGGRYQEYAPDCSNDTAWFWRQLAAVEYGVRAGPGHQLRWAVPDPKLHDDLVISAALCALLDQQDFRPRRALALPDRAGW